VCSVKQLRICVGIVGLGARGRVDGRSGCFFGQAGAGANVSYCVVDFGPASYAFKYYWDSDTNGFDMLQALQSDVQGFDFSYQAAGQGHFVTGFSYGGNSLSGDGSAAPDYMYWGYETSPDGQAFDMSGTGSDLRALSNGTWDAWKWMSAWDWPAPAPTIPGVSSVPEPSCAWALCSLIGLTELQCACGFGMGHSAQRRVQSDHRPGCFRCMQPKPSPKDSPPSVAASAASHRCNINHGCFFNPGHKPDTGAFALG